MRINYVILALITAVAVAGLWMSGSPEHAGQLEQARRDAAFTGQAREWVLTALAVGIGAFILYLVVTRR
ncbi:MAG TPA: hypothetical protein VM434_14075 [Beijerinckiaceae bacterium]|nr:hypothetical protein [Beijerinckiaceae bacterium]